MNLPGTQPYHLGRTPAECHATGAPIAPGTRYVAVLVEREDSDELERLAFSVEAWEAGRRPDRPERVVGFWRSVAPAPDAKRRTFVDDGALMDLFEQLREQTEQRRVAFRFVLALILIRRKKLVLQGTSKGALLVRRRGDGEGEVIEVADPGLDDSVVDEVTEQLSSILAYEPA